VARRVLWGLLALAPLTIALHYAHLTNDTTDFVIAALALIPLAWLIGEATEHAAHHTGPGIGGFLNATFGNAPELIIAMIAVNDGLTEVVRGSLTGSVVGNLLLVLGFSLLLGKPGAIDRVSSYVSLGLVFLATLLFLIPAIPGATGNPDRHDLAVLSLPVAGVLLVLYVVVQWFQLRRHKGLHAESGESGWPLHIALAALAVATVATALIAEILVGSLESFAEKIGWSDFFVAAVIVAVVGNAAEHGGAVLVARRGRIRLATEIALASSAQVAVFLIPAVAILSWFLNPLSLAFGGVELTVLGGSTLFVAALLARGCATPGRGAALVAAYGGAVTMFAVYGDRF
jgi:Ca2+:H+ antiporter